MAETISCPMCQADVVLEDEQARALCSDCHGMSDQELVEELQKRVERALWQALHAVEEQAAYGRWAAAHGQQVPPSAEDSARASELLRTLLSRQERPS